MFSKKVNFECTHYLHKHMTMYAKCFLEDLESEILKKLCLSYDIRMVLLLRVVHFIAYTMFLFD